MFINFWYAAEESRNITDTPVHVKMLGQEFALFRDTAGKVHCVSNICTHRGASLAHGKVRGDAIECPYHGWQFRGADGVCAKIPSLGKDGKIPARAKVDSYPTQEKYGLVFCFLGDLPEAERPPIIDIPEWGDPKWRMTTMSVLWKVNALRGVENTLDPAHTEFVHPVMGFQGDREDYEIPKIDLIERDWGTGAKVAFVTPGAQGSVKAEVRGSGFTTEAESGHHGPTTTYTWIQFSPVAWSRQYTFNTPVDAFHTRKFFFQARNFALDPAADERMDVRTREVMNQDRVVMERVQPFFVPLSPTEEVIVPADRVITRYRERQRDWQSKGWLMDLDALDAAPKNKSYAIPSPARRSSKGWALDAIPLRPAGNAAAQAAE
ncbi:MAG: aromatic ring-hydroxylating dioxygenase subunit alpha [Rhodospirillaceae bacterium]|nr:aromatic ring-hydroxylating dioxygenase subunit alpha [Rhodospirillaceae bacterium]